MFLMPVSSLMIRGVTVMAVLIFPLILQTVISLRMLFTGGWGEGDSRYHGPSIRST